MTFDTTMCRAEVLEKALCPAQEHQGQLELVPEGQDIFQLGPGAPLCQHGALQRKVCRGRRQQPLPPLTGLPGQGWGAHQGPGEYWHERGHGAGSVSVCEILAMIWIYLTVLHFLCGQLKQDTIKR